ncbi:MAG: tetratricopeptide repeat protein [Candidatus Sumerlaeaceae bacterium]|nr:tetratricopeptide repeat protein [Candidatus Sumerlaeaceae bacterium]
MSVKAPENSLPSSQLAPTSARAPSTRPLGYLVLILLLAAVALYAPTVRYGFVWDDTYFLVRNTTIRSWSTWLDDFRSGQAYAAMFDPRFFRPVRNWTYRLDWQIAKLNPAWWHVHNVALHAANTVLVFFLLRIVLRLSISSSSTRHDDFPTNAFSFVAALAWSFHPVQTESVCWIKSRDELLFTFFALIALVSSYSSGVSPQPVWRRRMFAVSAGSAMLAFLSKEMAVSLPLLLAFTAWLFARHYRLRRRLMILAGVFAVEAALYVILRHRVLGSTAMCGYLTGSFVLEMLTMLRAFAHYLALTVWPRTLVADYSHFEPTRFFFDQRCWVALGVLSGVIKLAYSFRHKAPLIWGGVAWFFISLLPVSNVIPTMQFLAERFLYFPLIGAAITFVGFLDLAKRTNFFLPSSRRRGEPAVMPAFRSWVQSVLVAVVAAAAVVVLAGRTALRMGVWHDELSLYAATLQDAPRNWRALTNVVIALANRASSQRDIDMAERWLQNLRNLKDPVLRNANARMLVRAEAAVAMRQGRFREAAKLWEHALQFSQQDVDALIALGVCRGMEGLHQEALELFLSAVSVDPMAAGLKQNVVTALQHLGRAAEAEAIQRGQLSVVDLITSRPR